MTQQFKYITWEKYDNLVNRIYEYFKDEPLTAIYGIPRGGLIPAVILSHKFDIPLLTDIDNTTDKNILIVDDIIDSGETIKPYIIRQFKTASVYVNKKRTNVYPTFNAETTENWIIFPYEKDVSEDNVSKVKFNERT